MENNEPINDAVNDTTNDVVDSGSNDVVDSNDTSVDNLEQTTDTNQEPESKESFIKRWFGKKGVTDNSSDPEQNTTMEEDISESFTEVALKAGWSEDDIVEFAGKYSNKELDEMIPLILAEDEDNEPEDIEDVDPTKTEFDLGDIDEKLKPYVDQIAKALEAKYQEKIGAIEESLKDAEQERSLKKVSEFQTTADSFFDKLAENYPVFGKTEELLRYPAGDPRAGDIIPHGPAYEARQKVWETAKVFQQMGTPWDKALDEAAAWYRGKNLEKDVRSKVVKELKKNEKRLSPKRSEHTVLKEFSNPSDERTAVIEQLKQQIGLR